MIALAGEKRESPRLAAALQIDAMNQTPSSAPRQSSLLHANRLKQLYAALLRSRDSGELSRGGQAIVAAASLELGPDDYLLPEEAGEIAGKIRKNAARIGHDESLSDVLRIVLSTGVALGLKMTQQPGIVMALSKKADPAADFARVFAFAARSKLPIIYLLESAGNRIRKSNPHYGTLPIIFVEGSDAVAILRVIQECARRARQGHGPALVECSPATSDPLKFMEEYLRKRQMWSDEWRQSLAPKVETKPVGRNGKKGE